VPEFLFFYNKKRNDYTISSMIFAMKTISTDSFAGGVGALLDFVKKGIVLVFEYLQDLV